jgi:ABC-type multidrug transport system permease subunit
MYRVDTIMGLMLGAYHFGLLVDLVVLAIFALVVVVIGTLSFRRMKL